jgi:hypothetical protein
MSTLDDRENTMPIEMTPEDKHLWENCSKEHYMVSLIRRYLLTADQRETLHEADLSIEDMLNGRFGAAQESLVLAVFSNWNETLGEKYFHF